MIFGISWQFYLFIGLLALALGCIAFGWFLTSKQMTIPECLRWMWMWIVCLALWIASPVLRRFWRKSMEASE